MGLSRQELADLVNTWVRNHHNKMVLATANYTDKTTHADALRETMIGELREMGAIRSDRVADAFRAVPRHLFAPRAPLAAVYDATDSVVVKRDEHGVDDQHGLRAGASGFYVDIEPEVTDRASSLLDAVGYSRVNVVLADAENGVPEHAPYDRIIVTVGAWDVPPAWLEQLADGGRIVVPLRMGA